LPLHSIDEETKAENDKFR